ncbi:MAG: type II toxin-antitoxin system ParD family antitoxin [Verrucomicrobia bacterium]|nr:type II toxin-antitoxin system ParD family antitoxin [Verrucomicrobiota bacterium]
MAFALAKENEAFIKRMISSGRFGNQSEIVREALRRMEREEMTYLNPPPMTAEQARQAFAPDGEWEKVERAAVRKSAASLRRVKRWEDL